jgi:uncharacterized protein GlcG (DUF336 family)
MFTLEHVNSLLGTRQHRKAAPYVTKELALERANEEAKRTRSFVTINVLDARGNTVASVKGKA